MLTISEILKLEESKDYISAFETYKKQFSVNQDFELWKHYYFFLWYIVVEDFSLGLENFVKENKIEIDLKEIGLFGLKNFINNSEALFILGYTISLFPYYFGDYEKLESQAKEMLLIALNNEPDNIIYKLAYLGSNNSNKELYNLICLEASKEVVIKFKGKGLLNSYFKEALYRINN